MIERKLIGSAEARLHATSWPNPPAVAVGSSVCTVCVCVFFLEEAKIIIIVVVQQCHSAGSEEWARVEEGFVFDLPTTKCHTARGQISSQLAFNLILAVAAPGELLKQEQEHPERQAPKRMRMVNASTRWSCGHLPQLALSRNADASGRWPRSGMK